MKHLNVFNSVSEYNSKKDHLQKPYVTYITENKGIDMNDNVKRVTINNQNKSVDIKQNGSIELVADGGYTGLGKVTINTNVASGGGGVVGIPRKAVNFIDCDGTTLHSYTKEEFLALSQLPELPTRQGLICQEWNWSLEDAQAQVAKYGICEIGATYITDDGKTRLYIEITAKGRMDVPLRFRQTIANGTIIDWGDGSAPQTFSEQDKVLATHTYADIGEYIISLDPAEGCTIKLGHASSLYPMIGSSDDRDKVYLNMLKKVEIGQRITDIVEGAFQKCLRLSSITIPTNVKYYYNYCLSECPSLCAIVIPKNTTSFATYSQFTSSGLTSIAIPKKLYNIGSCTFQGCTRLTSIVIPEGMTALKAQLFQVCTALTSIVIPEGVTTFENWAFCNCYGMAICDCRALKSVPTIDSFTFSGTPSDCKIVVPDALYDEWIAATNWAAHASKIVKASEFNA